MNASESATRDARRGSGMEPQGSPFARGACALTTWRLGNTRFGLARGTLLNACGAAALAQGVGFGLVLIILTLGVFFSGEAHRP